VQVSTLSCTSERKLTMDDEDAGRSWAIVSNAQEMNVVLSKCHNGGIIVREIKVLDEIPPDGF
jgi:hypothetical protein